MNTHGGSSSSSSSQVEVLGTSTSSNMDLANPLPLSRNKTSTQPDLCSIPGVEQVRRLFAKQNLHSVPVERVNEIPVNQRMNALQDLHGASDKIPETRELIDLKTKEMNELLSNPSLAIAKELSEKQRKAYYWACEQDKNFVNNWKICFLRADQFDVEKATIRIFRYFDTKLLLFGKREILGREIKLTDFDDNYDDKLGVEKGIFHFLRHRDSIGRAIIFVNPVAAGRSMYPIDSLMRMFFWITSVAARENESIQREGFVLLWYGLKFEFDGKLSECGNHYFGLFPSLPLKVNSVHCCYQDPMMTFYFSFMSRTIASKYLLQFQSHMGTHLECRYNLMTFGIPPNILPVDLEGNVSTYDYKRLLAKIAGGSSANAKARPLSQSTKIELVGAESTTSPEPGPMDVVMGRGSTSKRGQGYNNLRALLEKHYEEYYSVTRFEKSVISRMIYERMIESGSRFMAKGVSKRGKENIRSQQSSSEWRVLAEEDARDRIAHAFRNLRQLKK